MKAFLLITTLPFCIICCKQKNPVANNSVANKPDSIKHDFNADSTEDKVLSRYDSLIIKYITESDNEIIQATRKGNFRIEWMLDNTQQTDTATYLIFHIGHTNDNFFVTDGWLYIDSARKYMYEYDIAKDSLMRWR